MSKSRILELMTRKLSGEATPEELQELQEHLSADPETGDSYNTLDQFWSHQEDEAHPSVEENLRKVLSTLDLPQKHRIPAWMKIAAALLILAGAATVFL